jgi:hypothetical protein
MHLYYHPAQYTSPGKALMPREIRVILSNIM